jgi:hypothetical protein
VAPGPSTRIGIGVPGCWSLEVVWGDVRHVGRELLDDARGVELAHSVSFGG